MLDGTESGVAKPHKARLGAMIALGGRSRAHIGELGQLSGSCVHAKVFAYLTRQRWARIASEDEGVAHQIGAATLLSLRARLVGGTAGDNNVRTVLW